MPSIKSYWKRFGPIKMELKHNLSTFHSWMDTDKANYHESINFNTLTHVTSLENAEAILQEGLKMHTVGVNYSCITKAKDKRGNPHPLMKTPVLFMATDNQETTTAIRYGNVAFSLKNLSRLKKLKFYYVEFVDYMSKVGVRVLLTTKDYDHLFVRFDPMDEKQHDTIPFFYDGAEWSRHTQLSKSRNGDKIQLDVELILDFVPPQCEMCCRYVKCYDPKPFFTASGKLHGNVKVHNGSMDVLRLIALLARYQGYNCFQFRSNAFVHELISALQRMDYRDDFLPEHSIDELMCLDEKDMKPDFLLSQIDFGKVFDTKEFSAKHWKKVQILDFVYHQSSALPNVQTLLNVLNKGVGSMQSEKTAKETLTLFLHTFLSGRAKRNIKRMLVNLICSL